MFFRGIGVERIFMNFLKIYSDPKNLVLVLNTTQQEEVNIPRRNVFVDPSNVLRLRFIIICMILNAPKKF